MRESKREREEKRKRTSTFCMLSLLLSLFLFMAFAEGELLLCFQTACSAVFAKRSPLHHTHTHTHIHTAGHLYSLVKVGFVGEGEEF